ncbi:VWA domain-containing protein [Alphaproteobacteria bacterium]|nr:VWA domain-containing protein [Alphaproteobacteria bacterium]MDB2380997.1 VWA domain-containing protein [Alphaproteobacteria bacterium]MDB2541087.1 VWA domain-containing protein [Alphaproteobacteria bacterium]MDB2626743.1 VWA domain-containing protein [Alphaproteobacteria bacterium]MDB2699452.1 VWA domain-containing protein [Alphaproteobacteria bacterium]
MSDNAINAQKSGWFGRMRARLVAVPPRVWWSLLAASLALHIVAVGVVLVLLFGGERGGGADADSIVISAGEAGPEELDLVLPQDNQVELPRLAEAELDLSELLEVPLEADFNDLMMDNAQMATIAPAMPMPSAAVTQRALPGGGLISGVPQSFADYIEHLQKTGIDVVFAIDATGSMVWVHRTVRQRMAQLAEYVRGLVPLARFGIIAYRDYNDPDFVTRISQPSFDIQKARSFMSGIDALGGGDHPEAVTQALRDVEGAIGWRSGSQRVVIIIGDAPPHGRELGEAADIAERFKSRGGRLSLLDSRVEANRALLGRGDPTGSGVDLIKKGVMPVFRRLARLGGGTAATLAAERQLMKTLALLIFDDRFHDELAPFLANLE